jgi:putative ABC transport system permease protein
VLHFFLRDELAEEVTGDLEERFQSVIEKKSVTWAKLIYWYEVLNYVRPFAIRKSKRQHLTYYYMFENYFKIGWRNLIKQKMYSSIKIGGFAIGIAACLLIALFIRDELSYDLNYPDGDRLYRVLQGYKNSGDFRRWAWFQAPFASALRNDYPEIEKVGRYNASPLFGAGSKEIRPADKIENTFEDGFAYFDQELLDIFQYPMIYGNRAHALDEPNTIVITKRKADKYFPNENPVGKAFVLDNNVKTPYKIGGVIQDFPANAHLQFDFLMTMKGVEFWPGEQNDWGATNYMTYVVLKKGIDAAQFEKRLTPIVGKYLLPFWIKEEVPHAQDLAKNARFELQPVRDIHLRSAGINDHLTHGDIRFIWLFAAVAFFILLLAVINFVNLSTARSANRAKEVGLRKTVGSRRISIVSQFLTESLLYSVLSFALGLLGAWLLLPYFNHLASKSIMFPWKEWQLFPALLGAAILVGLLAGLYPSFYLSSFKPASVLKGNVSRGSKSSTLRSTLVVFQFTTSIILVIATLIIYRQVEYMLTKKAGFDKDHVILIQGTGTVDNIRTFKDELLRLANVKSATISDYLPIRGTKRNGNGFWIEGRETTDASVAGQFWIVDSDYIKTMGMKIVDGRDFSEKYATDSINVIINQAMAKQLGLKDPVGKRIQNNKVWNVIGVVEDFHFETMREQIAPLVMRIGYSPGIVSVKVNSNNMSSMLSAIDGVWKKFSPNQAIRFAFLDESFARMYDDVQRMGRIFTSFAVLAIIVACLGLFALSAFMVEQRGKEISIRMVLGASLNSILRLLSENFVKLVLISIVIAVPVSWYFMNIWLQEFTYRTIITWDVFIASGSMAVIIAMLTVSFQLIRAGRSNPSANLRSE